MPEYDNAYESDKPALCTILLFTLFTVSFNGYATYAFIKGLLNMTTTFTGNTFDCHFYPKIPVLAALLFLTALTLLLLVLTTSSFCYEDPTEGPAGSFVLYSLYFLFGPIMCAVCFFFLYNMETYGYTCTSQGKKVYNSTLHVVTATLGAIGVLITVGSFAKTIMQKLSYAMTRRNGCCTRFMGWFIAEGKPRSYEDDEERVHLQVQSQF